MMTSVLDYLFDAVKTQRRAITLLYIYAVYEGYNNIKRNIVIEDLKKEIKELKSSKGE